MLIIKDKRTKHLTHARSQGGEEGRKEKRKNLQASISFQWRKLEFQDEAIDLVEYQTRSDAFKPSLPQYSMRLNVHTLACIHQNQGAVA
jgi:hypothetical protein